MIISDLKHFEEFVANAPSIIGGRAAVLSKVIDSDLAKDLKDLGFGNILNTQVNVQSNSVNNSNGAASVETSVGKTKTGEKVKSVESNSSAVSK